MRLELELTTIAKGGLAVARHQGRVVFVRGGIPGERVLAEVTDSTKASFWRAEVVQVLLASPHRVSAPCEIANRCGGCDFQFIEVSHQRELKRQLVAEQLKRLAGVDWQGIVEKVDPSPLGWRTRMRYGRGSAGFGLRAARSNEIVPLPANGCLIAHPAGRRLVTGTGEECTVTVSSSGVAVNGVPKVVTELVGQRSFQVDAESFWQIHPAAAKTLSDVVLALLQPQAGERALDLFCGVGLFAKFLVAAQADVLGIEGNHRAVQHARANVPQADFYTGDVTKILRRIKTKADLVVLDPPRAGAGKDCIAQIAAVNPRAIAYVSCDPATFARDLEIFSQFRYQTKQIRAFDLFPMTQHVECVGLIQQR